MSYDAVDATIVAWADSHGLTLCTEFGGVPRRFCYVTGGEHECFGLRLQLKALEAVDRPPAPVLDEDPDDAVRRRPGRLTAPERRMRSRVMT